MQAALAAASTPQTVATPPSLHLALLKYSFGGALPCTDRQRQHLQRAAGMPVVLSPEEEAEIVSAEYEMMTAVTVIEMKHSSCTCIPQFLCQCHLLIESRFGVQGQSRHDLCITRSDTALPFARLQSERGAQQGRERERDGRFGGDGPPLPMPRDRDGPPPPRDRDWERDRERERDFRGGPPPGPRDEPGPRPMPDLLEQLAMDLPPPMVCLHACVFPCVPEHSCVCPEYS